MRSYPVKENHIGSAISEILWYKQTDIFLLYYNDVKNREGGDNGLFTSPQTFIITFSYWFASQFWELYLKYLLVGSLSWVNKRFNHQMKSIEGIILWVIILDKFISHCPLYIPKRLDNQINDLSNQNSIDSPQSC